MDPIVNRILRLLKTLKSPLVWLLKTAPSLRENTRLVTIVNATQDEIIRLEESQLGHLVEHGYYSETLAHLIRVHEDRMHAKLEELRKLQIRQKAQSVFLISLITLALLINEYTPGYNWVNFLGSLLWMILIGLLCWVFVIEIKTHLFFPIDIPDEQRFSFTRLLKKVHARVFRGGPSQIQAVGPHSARLAARR